MSLKLDRALRELKASKLEINELQGSVVKLTTLVQQLLDGTTGLERVFTTKIREMVEENLAVEITYEEDTKKLKEFLESETIS